MSTGMMGVRGLAMALTSSLCVLVGLVFVCVPAFASTGYRYAGQFSTPGGGPGEVSSPSGVAVRQSTGDVYVLDPGNGRVEIFDSAGVYVASFDGSGTPATAFSGPSAIAVDQSSGDVYVADTGNNAVDEFSAAGAYLTQLDGSATPPLGFVSPTGVAVDPSDGTVYVSDTADNIVDVYSKTGTFITSFDGAAAGEGSFLSPTGIAVDKNHDVYVVDSGKSRVEKYTAEGAAFTSIFDTVGPAAIAIDPTSSDVFVGENGPSGFQVTEFASSGSLISTFGPPHLVASIGLGVNSSTGTLYVADQALSVLERFTTFLAPTVATEAATAVEATEATLAGTINPEGVAGATTYRFDWGIEAGYGNSTEPVDTGGGSADVPAGAVLTGLSPGSIYHYRLVGTNSSGSSFGADETFTTAAAAPAVDVQGSTFASAIGTGGATFNDIVNPNGADTTYRYEYGLDTSYGSSTTDADAGAVTGETPASASVTGLEPGTIYHVRIVAENGVGAPVDGADSTFTTAPATAPTATEVTAVSAVLHGAVIPTAAGSNYHFEYGTDTSYGTSTPEQSLSAGTEAIPVSSNTFALQPGTEYHFRVVATTNGQTVSSDDATLTTAVAASVTTTAITGVTPTTATLNASIDTHGVAGTASFAVTSPNSPYTTTTAAAALSATQGPQAVSVPLSGLPAGAEYVVQASATVAGLTAWGEQEVFSTPALPPFNPTPPPPPISGTPYGCTAPHIDPVNTHPKPGDTVTVTGSDLGVGGTIALGNTKIQPGAWSSGSFTFTLPEGESGAEPLTINCGTLSNTVALTVLQSPSNAFTITKVKIKGATATLSVRVPGPGKLQITSGQTAAASKTIAKASTVQLAIHLSRAGERALSKSRGKKLAVKARISFTPAGGTAASQTRTLTLKRGGTR